MTGERELVLTYDCGTMSVKAAVFDLDGALLGHAARSYPVHSPQPGWAEQNPEDLWSAACAAGRAALATVGPAAGTDVRACVFVAPWKGVIPVDVDGTALLPAITWLDQRAAEDRVRLSETYGVPVASGADYWANIGWLARSRPDVWAAARHVVGLNGYLRLRACGVLTTEPSDDFLHTRTAGLGDLAAEVLAAAGTDADDPRFPASRPSTDVVGEVTREAAEQLGVPVGTAVVNGFGDLPAITTGAGRSGSEDCHIYIGTSSWLTQVTTPRPEFGAAFQFALDGDRTGVAVGAVQGGCLAVDWITAQTYRAEQERLAADFWTFLDEELAAVPPAVEGLIGTHWFNGEPDPIGWGARAVFVGLTMAHDRRHMVRAVMESIAMTHRMALDRLAAVSGPSAEPLRVVGGGAASDVWMQILADVLGTDIEVPLEPRLIGTRGTFYCALVGLGLAEGYEQAAKRYDVPYRAFHPQPAARAVYDEVYTRYLRLPDPIRGLQRPSPS